MAEILDYKCPCCGGQITFDSSLQKMKCPYCDTTFDVQAFKEEEEAPKDTQEEIHWEEYNHQSGSGDWQTGEAENLVTYTCNSCGGQVVGDKTTGATSCPYCGNSVIVAESFQGMFRPDYVIPFKVDKNAAKAALARHLKGKFFLPKPFKDQNRIEKITGLYVPFWLFNCDVDADIRYRATRVSHWSDSNYNYTRTDYYSLYRSGSLAFDSVPVDGSSKIEDSFMESIEPFDYSQAVSFQTAYLAGYLSDRYDVDAEASKPRANERIRNTTTSLFGSTAMGYATCVPSHVDIRSSQNSISYALLPVWILNTKYHDKTYTFAMNGQTGKFIGDLPCDWKKFWGIYAAILGSTALVLLLLLLGGIL